MRLALSSPELGERREVLVAERVKDGFRILSIPAFVYGVGHRDVVRILDDEAGTFEVVRRSGEVAVRVYAKGSLDSFDAYRLVEEVIALDGVYEVGPSDSGPQSRSMLLLSLPISLGLKRVGGLMGTLPPEKVTWEYGNVFDSRGAPTNWWLGGHGAMRVELALFDGTTLLERGEILVGAVSACDHFTFFHAAHHLVDDAAEIVLSGFPAESNITTARLDMPAQQTSEWEFMKLFKYTLAYRRSLAS